MFRAVEKDVCRTALNGDRTSVSSEKKKDENKKTGKRRKGVKVTRYVFLASFESAVAAIKKKYAEKTAKTLAKYFKVCYNEVT